MQFLSRQTSYGAYMGSTPSEALQRNGATSIRKIMALVKEMMRARVPSWVGAPADAVLKTEVIRVLEELTDAPPFIMFKDAWRHGVIHLIWRHFTRF